MPAWRVRVRVRVRVACACVFGFTVDAGGTCINTSSLQPLYTSEAGLTNNRMGNSTLVRLQLSSVDILGSIPEKNKKNLGTRLSRPNAACRLCAPCKV